MEAQSTPLSLRVLQQVLDANQWKQEDLADRSKIHRSTVSMHLSGQRPIRDEHLVLYVRALDRQGRQVLISAWLRDVFGPDVVGDLVDKATNRVRDEILEWAPKLGDPDRQMLALLVSELARDPELADVFRSLIRRAGYKPV